MRDFYKQKIKGGEGMIKLQEHQFRNLVNTLKTLRSKLADSIFEGERYTQQCLDILKEALKTWGDKT